MVVSVNQMSSNHKSDALFMTLLFFFAWRRLDKIKVNEYGKKFEDKIPAAGEER